MSAPTPAGDLAETFAALQERWRQHAVAALTGQDLSEPVGVVNTGDAPATVYTAPAGAQL